MQSPNYLPKTQTSNVVDSVSTPMICFLKSGALFDVVVVTFKRSSSLSWLIVLTHYDLT